MTNKEWLDYLAHNAPDELAAWFDAERITNQAEMLHMPESHESANPDCSAMLYKTFTGNMCSHYEPKDGVVAILREAARNLSDYHDAGEALRRLTDTLNVYHALETLADMIERDYVRREYIEEVMDNDRALVEENSMLAGELLKLRAELERATNNLNSANKDFENARAELTAERDELKAEIAKYEHDCGLLFDEKHKLTADAKRWADAANSQRLVAMEQADKVQELTAERDELKELNEYHALQYELASEDCDRLQAQVDELTAERDNLKANNEQLHTLAGEQAAKIDELTAERDKAREESVELYSDLVKASDEREHYREKCSKMATIIHDALMVMDEGMA